MDRITLWIVIFASAFLVTGVALGYPGLERGVSEAERCPFAGSGESDRGAEGDSDGRTDQPRTCPYTGTAPESREGSSPDVKKSSECPFMGKGKDGEATETRRPVFDSHALRNRV